jgi:ABC-type polysaccharide/polyol phosphate export permease
MSTAARPRSSIWSYRFLILNFARRDLKSRFKGTILGWAWSLMVPLATLTTYSLVFYVFFHSLAPDFGNGTPGFFAVWLFVGLVPWNFFLIAILISMPTLLANGALLQKVYFPSYVLVQTLIEFSILAVVLILFRNVGPTWLLFPLWLVLFVVFVTALALSLSIVNVHVRDLAQMVNVALTLLFFLTPIIYQISVVPTEWQGIPFRTLVQLSPISDFVISLRHLLYDLQVPDLITWLGLLAWTAGAVAMANFVYRRYGQDIGESV